MKLRPVFQIPWSGRPPPRAGRAAARFGAQLTARTARHPVCGEPFLPPNFRRRVAGVPPVRREALRVGCGFSFSRADVKTPEFRGSFSLKLREHCQICASRRIKGGKLKAILKYISQNKVGASRRAEKCRSLRVRKWGEVEMQPSAMRAGRPCTAQGLAESARSDTATQPGTTSSGPQA